MTDHIAGALYKLKGLDICLHAYATEGKHMDELRAAWNYSWHLHQLLTKELIARQEEIKHAID